MIKLLIVDDEGGFCNYLKDFFSLRGHKVFTASNAKNALSLVEKESPEIVLLDVNMPDTNGLEVLRLIKKSSPQTKVIMVTVNDDEDTKEKARLFGADEFVKKPFTTDYLQDVVMLKVNEITQTKEPARILIVDDDEGIRDSLKGFLTKRFECSVREADEGAKALEFLRKDKFDLVFLDIKMPGINGTEIIKEKKKLSYKPAIWVITGFDSEEVAHKVIEQGADEYIPKPLSLRALDGKIRNFLASIGKYKPR
ncbi:MAG: response regulator [Candidatus Omnitrophota bacterium]|nr:response regulator [Candidatus Omnitrophota bacterium]